MTFSKLDQFLAYKMRFFRQQLDWPLKKVASELAVSIQQVQRYEQGMNKISASLLYELSKVYQTDVKSFFEGFEETDTAQDQKPFRILLIEDNSHDVYLFRKAVSEFDKTVDLYVLSDGEEALSFFQKKEEDFSPNIIFLDLRLPKMGGFDLLKSIKKRPRYQGIPIIILTNSLNGDDISCSYNLQASGFLKKSFDYEEYKNHIIQTLRYWMELVELPSFT